MAQESLADILRASDRKVTMDEIMKKICHYYNVRMSDLLSPRRSRNIARPRQMAMYLSKNMTSRSYPEIGKQFGNRDHTTVMHAVRKIEELKSKAYFDFYFNFSKILETLKYLILSKYGKKIKRLG